MPTFDLGLVKGSDGAQGPQGIQGIQGVQGNPGASGTDGITPNIQVGTTTTLPAGSSATVSRRSGDTDAAPIFDFGIPKGADGATLDANAYLPITGGTLTGKITVSTPSYPGVNIKETTGGRIDSIENNGAQMRLFNISPEGSSINSTALKLNPETNALVSMLQLFVVAASSASTYSLYGTHNITVATAAPTAALANDAVSMVYS